MLSVRMAYGLWPMAGRSSRERRPCSRDLRDLFAVNVRTRTRTYVVPLHVLAIRQRATASARDRCPVVAESVTFSARFLLFSCPKTILRFWPRNSELSPRFRNLITNGANQSEIQTSDVINGDFLIYVAIKLMSANRTSFRPVLERSVNLTVSAHALCRHLHCLVPRPHPLRGLVNFNSKGK